MLVYIIKCMHINLSVCTFIFLKPVLCSFPINHYFTYYLFYLGNVCAEYSHGGNRIQRNGNAPCKKCPNTYFSNESYNCKYIHIIAISFLKWSILYILSFDVAIFFLELFYMSYSCNIQNLFIMWFSYRSRMLWERSKLNDIICT